MGKDLNAQHVCLAISSLYVHLNILNSDQPGSQAFAIKEMWQKLFAQFLELIKDAHKRRLYLKYLIL